MALPGQLPTVHMLSPAMRQKRRLVHHRQSLVRRRTQTKNQVRSIFARQGLPLPPRSKAWTKAGVEQVRAESRPLTGCVELDLWRGRLAVELALLDALNQQLAVAEAKLGQWVSLKSPTVRHGRDARVTSTPPVTRASRPCLEMQTDPLPKLEALGSADERVKLLCTVPGVGRCLAETVVCHLDDVKRFKSAGQVGSYAGLVPRQMESGQMKRSGRITRQGPSLLRGMLVEVAWMVYRHNAWAKAFVTRLSRGVKGRKKIAIVALARKLLVILWAMLRENRPWREPAQRERSAADAPPASPPQASPPQALTPQPA